VVSFSASSVFENILLGEKIGISDSCHGYNVFCNLSHVYKKEKEQTLDLQYVVKRKIIQNLRIYIELVD
jgi:hypothetical protein